MSIQYEVEQLADSYGVADSFPKDFGYGEEEADIEDSPAPSDSKPRILLMGLRRSGKSSIQKVGRDVKLASRGVRRLPLLHASKWDVSQNS